MINLNLKLLLPFIAAVIAISAPSSSFASSAGGACTTSGAVEREGGQTLICNGSVWKEAGQIDTGGKTFIQIDEDSGSCTSDKAGRLSYDSINEVWEYCDGSSWLPFDQAGCLGPADCDAPGDVCTDGTVFVGCEATDSHRIFTTRCDYGQTWNGSSCAGSVTQQRWSDSTASATNLRVTGVVSAVDGQANTTALTNGVENGTGDSRSDAGVQAHNAATICQDLSANGYGNTVSANGTVFTDWYLPAINELYAMYINASAIGNFSTVIYHSSTEYSDTQDSSIHFSGTVIDQALKYINRNIRCVRRR